MSHTEPGPSIAGSIALIIVGLLILAPSGLCTGTLALPAIIYAITNPARAYNYLASVPIVLIVGGPFIVFGAGLTFSGIKELRRRKEGTGEQGGGGPGDSSGPR